MCKHWEQQKPEVYQNDTRNRMYARCKVIYAAILNTVEFLLRVCGAMVTYRLVYSAGTNMLNRDGRFVNSFFAIFVNM